MWWLNWLLSNWPSMLLNICHYSKRAWTQELFTAYCCLARQNQSDVKWMSHKPGVKWFIVYNLIYQKCSHLFMPTVKCLELGLEISSFQHFYHRDLVLKISISVPLSINFIGLISKLPDKTVLSCCWYMQPYILSKISLWSSLLNHNLINCSLWVNLQTFV